MRKGETMLAVERERRRVALTGRPRPEAVVAKLRQAAAKRIGVPLSVQHVEKLKDAWTRRDPDWVTPEFREKSGAGRRGKRSSLEHVAKIVVALTGKKASPEAR